MPYVAVCGPADPDDPAVLADARGAGRLLAERGHVVLTGGLGGVMAAAASGASSVGGTTVGLLPGSSRDDASPGLTVVLPTGLGEMRNALLVRAADVVLAIGCSWGTLSEIALATRTGVPVVALGCWDLPSAPGRTDCATVDEAIAAIDVLLP